MSTMSENINIYFTGQYFTKRKEQSRKLENYLCKKNQYAKLNCVPVPDITKPTNNSSFLVIN